MAAFPVQPELPPLGVLLQPVPEAGPLAEQGLVGDLDGPLVGREEAVLGEPLQHDDHARSRKEQYGCHVRLPGDSVEVGGESDAWSLARMPAGQGQNTPPAWNASIIY